MDFNLLEEIGLKKIKLSLSRPFNYFIKALMAGMYLGVALMLANTAYALFYHFDPYLGKFAYAAFFGLAFTLVVFLNGELFTGNTLPTIMPFFSKKVKLMDVLKGWTLAYVGNAIGVALIAFLFIQSHVWTKDLSPIITSVVDVKTSIPWGDLLIRAILCNFIVTLASYSSYKLQNEVAKIMVIFLLVIAFVLPGFEHSIANIGSFTLGISIGMTHLGLQMLLNVFIATIGNIIGGSIMLGLPIFAMFHPLEK